MAAEKRKQDTALKKHLLEEGYAYNFFKAVHLLEGIQNSQTLGASLSPEQDPVRFCVKPGFSFPASDIASIRNGAANKKPVISVNFMGLIGPKGILPDWYNEYCQRQNYKNDFVFTDFLDMFHHRLLSLFYLAWKKYRLPENYRCDGKDKMSQSLAYLVGLDNFELKRDPAFYRRTRKHLIFFSGMMSRSVPTASAISAVIEYIVGAPVEVEQFVPRMIPVHEKDRTCLGRQNGSLKIDAMCGGRIQDISTLFIVKIGPLTWEKYLKFQPRSENIFMIQKLITRIAGIEYESEIHLIVQGKEFPSLCLGGRTGAPLLGRTVLLRNEKTPYYRDVVIKATGRAKKEAG